MLHMHSNVFHFFNYSAQSFGIRALWVFILIKKIQLNSNQCHPLKHYFPTKEGFKQKLYVNNIYITFIIIKNVSIWRYCGNYHKQLLVDP